MYWRTLLVAAAGWLVLAPAGSFAQSDGETRVVVESFRGPVGASMRLSLIQSLEENGVVVVLDEELDAARARLGIDAPLDDADRVALARELHLNAFIDGLIRRERRSWAGTVRVYRGDDGTVAGTANWGGQTAASLGAIRRNGFARLVSFIHAAAPAVVEVPEPEPEPEPEPRPIVELPPPPPEPPPADPSSRYDAFSIALTGGTLYRDMDATVQVYESQRASSVASPESTLRSESRSYTSGGIGHFELGGRGEIYPGAFGDQPFPYLGALVSFSHSLGVSSTGRSRVDAMPVAVSTDQLELYAGLRFRYRFGPARREPEIRVDAGYGLFEFDLDTAALQLIDPSTVIPPMSQGYVQLGAGITYGVVPTYLTLGLEVAGRIGTNLGADTRNVWGTATAPSNGFSLRGNVKVEIPEIVQGIFLSLDLQYAMMITSFQGQVGCATAGACDAYMDPWADTRAWEVWPVRPPATPGTPADLNQVIGGPVAPVTDHYVRTQLSVGYAFY